MPSKKPHIKAYMTLEERTRVNELAKQANISVSELVRRLVIGKELPASKHHQDIRDLVKVAGDLARLGNLFKLALDDEDFNELQVEKGLDAFSVGKQIDQVREELKASILKLRSE